MATGGLLSLVFCVTSSTQGFVFCHTVCLHYAGDMLDPRLALLTVVHELTHVAQYRHLGTHTTCPGCTRLFGEWGGWGKLASIAWMGSSPSSSSLVGLGYTTDALAWPTYDYGGPAAVKRAQSLEEFGLEQQVGICRLCICVRHRWVVCLRARAHENMERWDGAG